MFAMYNPTAFGVGFVSFDVKFGEEARKFVKIRIPLCASETVQMTYMKVASEFKIWESILTMQYMFQLANSLS